jgi:hypothetical protein
MLQNDLAEIFASDNESSQLRKGDHPDFHKVWHSEAHSEDTVVGHPSSAIRRRIELLLWDICGLLNREIGAFDDCRASRVVLLNQILFDDDSRHVETDSESTHMLQRNVVRLRRKLQSADSTSLRRFIERVSSGLNAFAGIGGLIQMVDGAIVDIAASIRHLESKGAQDAYDLESQVDRDAGDLELKGVQEVDELQLKGTQEADDLGSKGAREADLHLRSAIEVLRQWDEKLRSLRDQPGFTGASIQEARAALQVAAIHWEFERLRVRVDIATRRRFELADSLGRPRNNEDSAARECLKSVHEAERSLYGAPFPRDEEFVLHVSRFASLRATLLAILGTEDGLRESLRLFEVAESGLSGDHPTHVFHRVIIHTQRAYTLMSIADRASRRFRTVADPSGGQESRLVSYSEFSKQHVREGLLVAMERLAEARAELVGAEKLLGRGRKNVRMWLRLYFGRAQLAIEELLRHCLIVEFDSSSMGKESTFVAETQDWLIFGLEAIRGAIDCRVYDESEEEDLAHAIKLYVQLFVVGRLTLQGYPAAMKSLEGERLGPIWQAMMSLRRLGGEQEFLERWEALNESVGLSRTFRYLVPPTDSRVRIPVKGGRRPTSKAPEGQWLLWTDIIAVCDDPVFSLSQDGSADHAETLRECALDKMDLLFRDYSIEGLKRLHPTRGRKGISWLVRVILSQRDEQRSLEGERRSKQVVAATANLAGNHKDLGAHSPVVADAPTAPHERRRVRSGRRRSR